MPYVSEQLQNTKQDGCFDEIHEVVRVFTIYNEPKSIKVRITIVRYYNPTSVNYDAWYERADEHGEWHEESFGSILSGNETEESAIMMAISLTRNALRL